MLKNKSLHQTFSNHSRREKSACDRNPVILWCGRGNPG